MEEQIDYLKYLKDNFTTEELLDNEKILEMVKLNHKINFEMDMRKTIEYIRQKYTNLYNYVGIFKNDRNNVNWERLIDIIYENIRKKYNCDIIYDEPENILNILEK